jgi:hypothetical protein
MSACSPFRPLNFVLLLCVLLAGARVAEAQVVAAALDVAAAPLPPAPGQLRVRDKSQPATPRPVMINGRPYQKPTQRELFSNYISDSYGLPAVGRTLVRTLYNEGLDQPHAWGQDFPGFAQRFGSNAAISGINGSVRYGMEELFHEDLRYIPCHGCSIKHKIENALLAEFTARHDTDGHRFFTLTPTVADFSGPIIAHTIWYPQGSTPFGGVVATRTVFATRVGGHLFREFVWERRHHDDPEAGRAVPSELPPPPTPRRPAAPSASGPPAPSVP